MAKPSLSSEFQEFAKAHLRRFYKSGQLRYGKLAAGLKAARHVLVAVVHNEYERLPYFLDYYRRMGFGQFIVIDNGSEDGTSRYLAGQDDVSVVLAEGSYKEARFGNDWVNHVCSRFCAGKWVLYADADEFLVFADRFEGSIEKLTRALDAEGQSSLQVVMLDMYGTGRISENVYRQGDDPLAICPYFDPDGYWFRYEEEIDTVWVKGGVRERCFFRDNPAKGPALNKTPLVRWTAANAYLKSAHQVWPSRLNRQARGGEPVAGALLHFKFLSSFAEKLELEARRQQHTEEYSYYRKPGPDERPDPVLIDGGSRRFVSFDSFAETPLYAEWLDNLTAPKRESRRTA